jgi:hypothetical protein
MLSVVLVIQLVHCATDNFPDRLASSPVHALKYDTQNVFRDQKHHVEVL